MVGGGSGNCDHSSMGNCHFHNCLERLNAPRESWMQPFSGADPSTSNGLHKVPGC